jgi:hypothetical protein
MRRRIKKVSFFINTVVCLDSGFYMEPRTSAFASRDTVNMGTGPSEWTPEQSSSMGKSDIFLVY